VPDTKGNDDDRGRQVDVPVHWVRQYAVVLEFLVALAVLGYAGWWLDERRGTNPWGLFGGLMAGTAYGLYRMIREANRLEK
jgi:F0F1-type ATP synthase assembly protein I